VKRLIMKQEIKETRARSELFWEPQKKKYRSSTQTHTHFLSYIYTLPLSLWHTHTWTNIDGCRVLSFFLQFRGKKRQKTFHFAYYFCYFLSLLSKESILQMSAVHHAAPEHNQRETCVCVCVCDGDSSSTCQEKIAQDDTRCQRLMAERRDKLVRRMTRPWRECVWVCVSESQAKGNDTEQSRVWKDNFPERPATLAR